MVQAVLHELYGDGVLPRLEAERLAKRVVAEPSRKPHGLARPPDNAPRLPTLDMLASERITFSREEEEVFGDVAHLGIRPPVLAERGSHLRRDGDFAAFPGLLLSHLEGVEDASVCGEHVADSQSEQV